MRNAMATHEPAGSLSITKLLRDLKMFEDFSNEELGDVEQIVTLRRFQRNEMIVRQGDPSDSVFLVLSGSVAVFRDSAMRETILSLFAAGQIFGEMSVFDKNAVRSASVRAVTTSILGIFSREDFGAMVSRSPKMARELLQLLADRLRSANESIENARTKDATSRLKLGEQFGMMSEGGLQINVHLTHKEMANMIGTTRETLNRTLNGFWDQKLIDMRTRFIVLRDINRIREMAAMEI
jgi:CRP/FNR family cyclic AMP-dependent transcriptional regulator